jgi:hypothetical protein
MFGGPIRPRPASTRNTVKYTTTTAAAEHAADSRFTRNAAVPTGKIVASLASRQKRG